MKFWHDHNHLNSQGTKLLLYKWKCVDSLWGFLHTRKIKGVIFPSRNFQKRGIWYKTLLWFHRSVGDRKWIKMNSWFQLNHNCIFTFRLRPVWDSFAGTLLSLETYQSICNNQYSVTLFFTIIKSKCFIKLIICQVFWIK